MSEETTNTAQASFVGGLALFLLAASVLSAVLVLIAAMQPAG